MVRSLSICDDTHWRARVRRNTTRPKLLQEANTTLQEYTANRDVLKSHEATGEVVE
jgi:hypothetical protein